MRLDLRLVKLRAVGRYATSCLRQVRIAQLQVDEDGIYQLRFTEFSQSFFASEARYNGAPTDVIRWGGACLDSVRGDVRVMANSTRFAKSDCSALGDSGFRYRSRCQSRRRKDQS
jgi:hypothetical protein